MLAPDLYGGTAIEYHDLEGAEREMNSLDFLSLTDQLVRGAALDCDGDTLLLQVEQVGPACHTGAHACFDVDPLEPVLGETE